MQAWQTCVLWHAEVKTVEWMAGHAECVRTLAAWRCVAGGATRAVAWHHSLADGTHELGGRQQSPPVVSNQRQESHAGSDGHHAPPASVSGAVHSGERAGGTGTTTQMMRHDEEDDLYELVDDDECVDYEAFAREDASPSPALDGGVGVEAVMGAQMGEEGGGSYGKEGGGEDSGAEAAGAPNRPWMQSPRWQEALQKEVERVRHTCQQDLLQVCLSICLSVMRVHAYSCVYMRIYAYTCVHMRMYAYTCVYATGETRACEQTSASLL
jgi:hypothetical protein